MDLIAVDSKQLTKALPQLVPGSTCFRCDVCCRFPEADSFLRPYFTRQEITEAVAHGVSHSLFPDKSGSQINLVKHPHGEGYLCPAFDAASGQCGIYNARPLDCQLYPLALMWDASGQEVLLGWDTKCPFMRDEPSRSIQAYAEQVEKVLRSDAMIEQLAANSRLIGRFQDDVVVLMPLPKVTVRIRAAQVDPRLQQRRLNERRCFGTTRRRLLPFPIITSGPRCCPVGGWTRLTPCFSLPSPLMDGSCRCRRSGQGPWIKPWMKASG
jgi:Fe-S-cluster containining protein